MNSHLTAVAILTVALTAESYATELRQFTVLDAVQAVRVIDPDVNSRYLQDRRPKVSPDGSSFFIVTFQGDVESGANRFRLQVLRIGGSQRHEVRDDAVLVMESFTNAPGIAAASWIDDTEIAFLGAQGREQPQVFIWNVESRQLTRRTHVASGVRAFWCDEDGNVAYITEPEPDPRDIEQARTSGYLVSDQHYPFRLSSDRWSQEVAGQRSSAHYLPRGSSVPLSIKELELFPSFLHLVQFWLLADTGYAIAFAPTYAHLDRWEGYRNDTVHKFLSRLKEAHYSKSFQMGFVYGEYCIVDLATGHTRPFVIAPGYVHRSLPDAIHVPGTRSVILMNSMIPLDQIRNARADALKFPAIIEVNLDTGRVEPVTLLTDERLVIRSVEWDHAQNALAVQRAIGFDGDAAAVTYRKKGGKWIERAAMDGRKTERGDEFASLRSHSLLAGIAQGLNESPRLVVTEAASRRSLYDRELNPQFREIHLSKTEVIEWTDDLGVRWRGGLMYPSPYDASKRYPLIIQTHGFNPKEFLIDGQMFGGRDPGAFSGQSARALAAKGFFVLQEYANNSEARSRLGTKREGPQFVASYRAIVRELSSKGLIDSLKVGLHGFSRTAYHVKYVLAHADYPIAAASVSDGLDFGYLQTMLAGPLSWPMERARTIYGSIPVGSGLEAWLAEAPTFNLSRVHSPVRIEANSSPSFAGEWEMYAVLRLLGTPSEITVYPDGEHRLIKPRERLRSQQGNVDWFSFWINGEEDPVAEKAEQYARWRAMREAWKGQHSLRGASQ